VTDKPFDRYLNGELPSEFHYDDLVRVPAPPTTRMGDSAVAGAVHQAELWNAAAAGRIANPQDALTLYAEITAYDDQPGQ
jgi:hypothetical protein